MRESDTLNPIEESLRNEPQSWHATSLIVIAWGLLAVYIVFGLPSLIKAWQAHFWVQTPCVVVSNTPVDYFIYMGRGPSSKVKFYGAALTYSYEFRGGKYTADRYSPSYSFHRMNGATEEVPRREHPIGQKLTCYVNPWNPSEAVIDPSFTSAQIWAMLLIPLLLLFVGILGPISIMRKVKARKVAASRE